ncbi:MAG: gliding motility-associated C-terminal domain-containing protein [Flavobacteriales bacterium]|nr:gliding motility-associated C-terminal domain-containing protein [Flavobacteriales bacterium]
MKKLNLVVILFLFAQFLFAQNTIQYNNGATIIPKDIQGKQINNTPINNTGANTVLLNNSITINTPVFESELWSKKNEASIIVVGDRQIIPLKYKTVELALNDLKSELSNAVLRTVNNQAQAVIIELPDPDGGTSKYMVYKNTTMSPGLEVKYPEIRTYDAINIDNPGEFAKIDVTPHGFHAMVMSVSRNTFFIDPYSKGDMNNYLVYYKKDFTTTQTIDCGVEGQAKSIMNNINQNGMKIIGTCDLRTYRLAVSATGEYTTFHGGTVALALAAQVITMNRVNGVFERDAQITMTFIPNNNLIVYTNAGSDPFTNGNPGAMINQNQVSTDAAIGAGNYDIGHVFGTNSGGLAQLFSPCTGNKARGVTGSGAPINDPFDIDYVAHEMGHQWGANHTQNNNCNRNNATAMEPGSASSIMGYAGICAPNVQSNSDDHFHGVSVEEMSNYISGFGGSCAVTTPVVNANPTITGTNGNITIPASTPFALTAIATDLNAANVLSYCWEQMDNQTSIQPPVATSTGGPNFRSISPLISPTRYFPNLADLMAGGPFIWEVLSSVNRTMNFRVTVRDNAGPLPEVGCIAVEDVTVTVDASSGPFVITYPSAAGITWTGATSETVTWNVAGTAGGAVACANVDIYLSIDGGVTFPTLLAAGVPNDGSQPVTVPNTPTTTAVIMVICSNGTFFDISDNVFTIIASTFDYTLSSTPSSVTVCPPADAIYTINVGAIGAYIDPVTLSASGVPAGATATFGTNPVVPVGTSTLTISGTGAVVPGSYPITISGVSTSGPKSIIITLIVSDPAPSAVTLTTPANLVTGVPMPVAFSWTVAAGAGVLYDIDIATDVAFSAIVDNAVGLVTNSYVSVALSSTTTYYWRVRAYNGCGTAPFSSTFEFETGIPAGCDTLNFPPPGTLTIYGGTGIGGYVTGWNTLYQDVSKAEYFSAASHAPFTDVTGGIFYLWSAADGGNGATVDFNVWDATGAGGSPGAVLGTVTVPLTALNTNVGGVENTLIEILYATPVNVGIADFYFGLTMNGFGVGDSLGIVSNTDGDTGPPATAWEEYGAGAGGGWFNYTPSWGLDVSNFMSPYMTDVLPTAVITANTITICEGDSVVYDGTTSVNTSTYNWLFPGGAPGTSITPTQNVTYTTAGNYTGYLVAGGACQSQSVDSIAITVNPMEDATFSYLASNYCQNDLDPTPTISGTGGGAFTSLPAGLSINGGSGVIDLSTSIPGTYGVLYTTPGALCPDTLTVFVTIDPNEDATFNYSAVSYCQTDPDPTPTISGTGGGTFTSSPVGLSINGGTGVIDLSTSTPGTYGVLYTTPGIGCQDTLTVFVTVSTLDDASFSYSAAAYCVNDTDPTPTITGVGGGGFTSVPGGLVINAGSGLIDVSASTPGAYTVTYTTIGSCSNSSNVAVTINALDDASFSYSSTAYCVNDADPTPTITGLGGGGFTSAPAGLAINPGTGVIDVSTSTPGAYTVTYTTTGTCPNSSNVAVTINALDDASFSYSTISYCQTEPDPTPTITGLGGGGFTSAPAGLVINAGSGLVDVSASTPGAYTVTYTTTGTCPNSSNVAITITTTEDATFNYSAVSYCQNDPDPTPTISGTGGGAFTSTPVGLSINGGSGVIDVSTSTPGTYGVLYTTPSASCEDTLTVFVTINVSDDASFSYSAAAYCVNDTDPTPTVTGLGGGGFTSAPAGLVINVGSGLVDVSASTPGAYTVTYTTTGTCPNSSNVAVTINALDDASFSYSAAAYCVNDTDPTPTVTGLGGGGYTSAPAGLVINAGTGVIDVSTSTPGAYTVTYTTTGLCPNSSNVAVTINVLDDASFSYSAAAYCVNDADPTPTVTGLGGGGFTSAPAGLVINGGTGVIDVSASTPGAYTVTYTTTGTCPNSSNVAVTINALDDASFSYTSATYCVNDTDPTPTVTGLGGGGYTSAPAGLVINAGSGLIDVSASTPGAYTVTYTTTGTCPNSSNVAVTIATTEDATFNYSAASYCQNDPDPTPTISGTGGGAFTSSPAGLVINGGSGVIDLSASTPGTYGLLYTTPGTCFDTLTVFITINVCATPPVASFSSTDSTLCIGDCIDFTDLSTGSPTGYTWYFFGASTTTSNAQNPTNICYNSSGTFDVALVVVNSAGQDSLFMAGFITVNPNPTVVANATNSAVCSGDQVTLTGSGAVSYTWDMGVVDGLVFTPTATNNYTVTGTDVNGCTNTDIITVTVNPLPTITASNDTSICASEFATISANGGTNYTWDNGLGNGQSQTVSPSITTTYTVTGDDANGCMSTDVVVVTIDNSTCFNIPNVFSPNGDGKNDTWVLRGIEQFPNANITIFNRWGSKMYSTSGYIEPWDGTYNGAKSPSATYYYIIDLGDGQEPISGTVNIIR